MKTLADMTEEERAQCRGMWCQDGLANLCIYMGEYIGRDWLAVCAYPESECTLTEHIEDLTPRYDLPSAWAPDGQPPAGEWEYTECLSMNGEYTCRRRWVGEWGLE